ncbi:MAG: hypothetical protein JWM81_109 [Candidatus Saccharibacteria bacterium]|nr:hypothetical protein [Candidatus Saccharibacteria bacterium]
MAGPESFSGGDNGPEVRHDPEVAELLEFLEAYKQIQALMAWLAEAGPGANPMLRGVRRGQMHSLMLHIGLDPESPESFHQLEGIKVDLSSRTLRPQPRFEVPEVGFFATRIKEITSEQERFGAPYASGYAYNGSADLVDVARLGHTDWRRVQSRSGRGADVSSWIHGVATIMADPIAYNAQFAGLSIDAAHAAPDHLMISDDWSIQNGRHRALAVRSLGEDFVAESGMAQWVPVSVE